MTQDEIIRMAREAGGYLAELPNGDAWLFDDNQQLERFAALVAAHEREACEKVCKDIANSQFKSGETETAGVLDHCAAAIRVRGEE